MNEIERSIPRRLIDEVEELQQVDTAKRPNGADIDPLAVGTKASEGVAAYIGAAQHIEATVAQIKKMADAIEKDGNALAADLRRRGAAMDQMVAHFAKLAHGTQQRMGEERKHLEDIAKGNGS